MLTYLFNILFFFMTPSGYSQQFEGEIIFVQESRVDTTFYSYLIKGNKIRYNELDSKKNIVSYMIIDLDKSTVTAVNPRQKLYTPIKINQQNQSDKNNFRIIKTPNSKVIEGYTCFQWRVINKTKDTEVAYWVAKDGFMFFENLVRLMNKSDKSMNYFLNIPDSQGYFPLEVTERSMLREFKTKQEVILIDKKSLDQSLFEVPSSYSLFYVRG